MRIGIFTNAYKPDINGVVKSISIFRQELVKQGHAVYIFAPESYHYQDPEYGIFRYPAVKLSKSIGLPLAIPVSPFVNWVVPRLKLDILHSQHPVLIGEEAVTFARELNLPHIFTYHSQYEAYANYVPFNQNIVKTLTREVVHGHMQRSVKIITPTPSIQTMLTKQHPELASRFSTLPSPIDLETFQAARLRPQSIRNKYDLERKFVFITVARLSKEKRFPFLLDAFKQTCAHYPGSRLLIVGDGPLKEELHTLSQEMGIAEHIVFTGRVDFAKVPDYLAASDAFVFASTNETQGLVLVEGMAVGLPIVAIDAPGIHDVIEDQHNGLLTANTPAALAQGMMQVMEDRSLCEAMSANALQTATHYSPAILTQRLVDLYQETIDQYQRQPLDYKRFSREPDQSRQFPPQWLNELTEEGVDSLVAFWQKLSETLGLDLDNKR